MKKPKIALFIHNPEASRRCCNGMIKVLSEHYDIKLFTEHECNSKTFKNIDIIAFPGGIGDADKYDEFFRRKSANVVADFIGNGGKYLGVCMGGYWAGHHYFDILDGINVVQYIKRPTSEIKRSYATIADVLWEGEAHSSYFYDGCTFIGDQKKFDTYATYSNGDPMAIIQNGIGLVGCHLESNEGWYDKKYLKPYWHKGIQHPLLLNFVDLLMQY